MHLVGTAISSWGITPNNDTIPFVDIPNLGSLIGEQVLETK